MEDYIKSGFGGEATDTTIAITQNKPIWHLAPLPLNQVQTSYEQNPLSRGPTRTLHSHCLDSISRNFHQYTPDSFIGLSPILIKRIMSRVRADRGYDEAQMGGRAFNPDEATIWAFQALSDPEDAEPSFNLAVPMSSTLPHLAPNSMSRYPEHPFVELPKLYASLQPSTLISLLTTLSLDGMDEIVNDQNVLTLKWCTHLTALWMKGSRVTDAAIRLLASALELPGEEDPKQGRGMWRLRMWSLAGCMSVSDRSMKSIARWPGLVMLDVRDTSCTSSGIDVFNRFSQSVFSNRNADFQPCTDGLLPLFRRNIAPSEILDNLCLSLLKLPTSASSSSPTRSHISFHLSPTTRPFPNRYLPEPPFLPNNQRNDWRSRTENPTSQSVYRGNGIGQIYGTSVSRVTDEVRSFRDNVKTAFKIQGEKEAFERMTPAEKRKKTMAEKKEREEWKRKDRDWYKSGPGTTSRGGNAGKIFKDSKGRGKDANERSKQFVKGAVRQGGHDEHEDEDVADDERKLMMVRMVDDHWEKMQWTVGGPGPQQSSPASAGLTWPKIQKASKASDLLDDIIGTTKRSTSFAASPSTNMFRPTLTPKPAPSPTATSNAPSSSPLGSSLVPPKRGNPFKQTRRSSSGGVRPLAASSQSSQRPNLSPSSQPPQSIIGESPSSSPFATRPATVSSKSEKKWDDDDGLSFSSTSRKRTFGAGGGSDHSVELKRRGMKMFSVGGVGRV
ncbi:hypothetical protein IAR55_006811 [Kwoniella newhampshirensis]|uniref:Meiotically up-regulated protein Msb1/Mug8 domain-containing protein n=1 Tax=Kwoniella newhampshirensis TaxID=1651941 RepID=A0AAW0YE22_9TREE